MLLPFGPPCIIGLPCPSIPVTVRRTLSPSASNFTVILCAMGIGLDFDFAVFNFQVPRNGLSAASRVVEIRKTANDKNRIRCLLEVSSLSESDDRDKRLAELFAVAFL